MLREYTIETIVGDADEPTEVVLALQSEGAALHESHLALKLDELSWSTRAASHAGAPRMSGFTDTRGNRKLRQVRSRRVPDGWRAYSVRFTRVGADRAEVDRLVAFRWPATAGQPVHMLQILRQEQREPASQAHMELMVEFLAALQVLAAA